MLWVQRLWLRLQSLLRRQRAAQRLDDEIQFHLEQQIAENIAIGMNQEEGIAEGIVSRGTQVGLRRWHEDSGQSGRLLRFASRVASQVGAAAIVLPCARIISEQPAADAEPHGSFRNGQQGAGAAPARQHRTGDQPSFTLFASSLQGFVRAADARPSVRNGGQK